MVGAEHGRLLSYSMDVGHVEKTNDRDYEVEERCGAMIEVVLHTTELDADGEPVPLSQAIPYHGISSTSTPKRSKRVSGLITR